MMLLTKAIEKKLLKAGERAALTGESAEKASVKLFDPCGRFTFYGFDAEKVDDDTRLFGYVISPLGSDCDEWGYVSLNEVAHAKNLFRIGIERDRWFDGVTREELREGKRP